MKIWLHPHDFAIKMMIPLALEAQGVLSQCRGRVFHDGASLTDSGKSRPKSQLQWDYHGITKTEDPQILDLLVHLIIMGLSWDYQNHNSNGIIMGVSI